MTFTTTMKKKLSLREEQEIDFYDELEAQWAKVTKNPSFAELIDMFPEAVQAARRAAKWGTREMKKLVIGLSDLRETCSAHVQSVHFSKQPVLIKMYDSLLESILTTYEKEIKKYQWQLAYLDNFKREQAPERKRDLLTPQRIEHARQTSIVGLLDIQKGSTRCPWHDDHKPSLKYYPKDNRVYCFACNHSGDAIDVYMVLNNCDFKEAVRRLAV